MAPVLGRVALEAPRAQFGSAEELISFMEHVAHPDGLPGLQEPVQ